MGLIRNRSGGRKLACAKNKGAVIMESRLSAIFFAVTVFMLTFGAENLLAQEPEPVFYLSFEKGLTPVSREEMKGEWQGKSPPKYSEKGPSTRGIKPVLKNSINNIASVLDPRQEIKNRHWMRYSVRSR